MLPKTYGLKAETLQPPDFCSGRMNWKGENDFYLFGSSSWVSFPVLLFKDIRMTQVSKNILLVSGSGQNVGKTSFIRRIIALHAEQKIAAIKITPHFHVHTSGLVPIVVTENYRVFEETDSTSGKDSSLFLQAGAEKVFYIQTNDAHLKEAFARVVGQLDDQQPVVVESAALRKILKPAFYLFIQDKFGVLKSSAFEMQKQADAILYSDSGQFSMAPSAITFNQTWKINPDDLS